MPNIDSPDLVRKSTIVVLVTTFNRVNQTVKCIDSLYRAQPDEVDFKLILVDAGSNDGTPETIRTRYQDKGPVVIEVTSDHYWAMGMRVAWSKAQQISYDFILWLNDDVILYKNSISNMLESWHKKTHPAVMVGALESKQDGSITYSGYRREHARRPLNLTMLSPSNDEQHCDTLNGNVVLIPAAVDRSVGGFPSKYTHSLADLAYGFEIRNSGAAIYLVCRVVGTCERDGSSAVWTDTGRPLRDRFKELRGPKGLPFGPWLRFCLSYGGPAGLLNAIKPYVLLLKGSGVLGRWLR
ncbi:glycosyltransferase family 2 protein [Rhodococcus cercidiphylli]|uniref:glycosyltransferase family 2 protein n=1 Tax=Rhodococcus cercidiphylli TaxID=489916 RepID=UPI00374EC84F